MLATTFAFFGYADILYFFLSLFPSYSRMAQHLSTKSMSVVNINPWSLGFVGLVAGGFLSGANFRRTGNAAFARKVMLVANPSYSPDKSASH